MKGLRILPQVPDLLLVNHLISFFQLLPLLYSYIEVDTTFLVWYINLIKLQRRILFMDLFTKGIITILPPIITGIFGFYIAKYQSNRNAPLEKLEIAYNRIYCPVSRLLHREPNFKEIDVDSVISTVSSYLAKYENYADRSTLMAFRSLCKYKNKETYQNFQNNIYTNSAYLRRRLGYLEPSIIQTYMYLSKTEQSTIRLILEFAATYFFFILSTLPFGDIHTICLSLGVAAVIILILEIIVKFLHFVYHKTKKLFCL